MTTINDNKKIKVKGDDLTDLSCFSYSIGHFLNDVCASCWFNFLGYYLVHIRGLSSLMAGAILFSGQIFDGISTPLVGIFSDKYDTRWGKRIPWYVAGTFLAIFTFLLIFHECIFCDESSSETLRNFYYLLNPSLFNVGWAMVQVSHMALLPSITINREKQDSMTRMRTGFTFAAQLMTLLLSLLIFYYDNDKMNQYVILSITCIIIGLIPTFLFLNNCNEVKLTKNIEEYKRIIKNELESGGSILNSKGEPQTNGETDKLILTCPDTSKGDQSEVLKAKRVINWVYWMKKPDYYIYMLVYMFIRLSINISATMIPFYCKNVLKWVNDDGSTPVEIVLVLIIACIGSIVNSILFEGYIIAKFCDQNKRLVVFSFATVTMILGCFPIYFITPEKSGLIFILSFFFGIGFSAGLSGATSFINDVVGDKGEKGAFVYGSYSFADKISCGIVLVIMLQIAESSTRKLNLFMSFFPPASVICALAIVYIRRTHPAVNDDDHSNDECSLDLNNSRISFIE